MINTKVIKVNPNDFELSCIEEAANAIKNGGLCAFPTETVYGLGANALSEEAVSKIFKAKGRPQDNPLIVHIADLSDLEPLVKKIPKKAEIIANHYWGGPITIIMERSDKIPASVSAGLSTVAIRFPSHPVATALIKLSGVPIAAPSANLSGKPSPTTARHVAEDMMGRADVIIDGGSSFFGVESTVLDATVSPLAILRPGAVTREELSELLHEEVVWGGGDGVPKSPGMKYKHYAPAAPLYIIESKDPVQVINSLSDEKTGVLAYGIDPSEFTAGVVFSAGNTPSEYAAHMFYYLREFDNSGVDKIYAVAPPPGGVGDAVRNRIFKSAGGKVICE